MALQVYSLPAARPIEPLDDFYIPIDVSAEDEVWRSTHGLNEQNGYDSWQPEMTGVYS